MDAVWAEHTVDGEVDMVAAESLGLGAEFLDGSAVGALRTTGLVGFHLGSVHVDMVR